MISSVLIQEIRIRQWINFNTKFTTAQIQTERQTQKRKQSWTKRIQTYEEENNRDKAWILIFEDLRESSGSEYNLIRLLHRGTHWKNSPIGVPPREMQRNCSGMVF